MGHSVPLQTGDYAVSPEYRVSDWRQAVESGNWVLKLSIFQDRLNGRYLKPIEFIERDQDIGQFAGFSIMALACLLVETLNQFYQGVDETPNDHKRQFWIFFRESENFRSHFIKRTSDMFYSHVRCGLLHQAQTKGATIIRADRNTMIEPIRRGSKDGIIVDRVHFLAALKKEIGDYVLKLTPEKSTNTADRENFVRKMWYICGE